MDVEVSKDVVCLNDELDEVNGIKKRSCLFGDAECQPVDVNADEYEVIPDRPPLEWYERYCLHDDLLPKSKALYKKAQDFYNEYELLRNHVRVEVPRSGTIDNVVVDAVPNAAGIMPSRRGRGRPPKQRKVTVVSKKRGRGRPLKQRPIFAGGVKRGRGRPPKQYGLTSSPPKRGRGRPIKKNVSMLGAENVSSKADCKKRARTSEIVHIDFSATQLCGGCCQKIGKKFGQDVKGKVLQLELVKGDLVAESQVVKRPRGRPRKACP